MITTEDEAKTKQCRQMFAAIVPVATRGSIAVQAQQQLSVGFGMCVASGCMAWRWRGSEEGYCGFAGAPEVVTS